MAFFCMLKKSIDYSYFHDSANYIQISKLITHRPLSV
jgi:hypothetical protein